MVVSISGLAALSLQKKSYNRILQMKDKKKSYE